MKQLILALSLATTTTVVFAHDHSEELSKVNGSVTAKSGQSYGDVSTVNGSISIESKATTKDVETVNGEITVDSGAKLRDVGTVNGGIVLRNGVSARTVETVNGSIVGVSNIRIEQSIEAVNGSIEIGAHSVINKDVENVNGSIKLLAAKVHGNVETVNGNITVGENSSVSGYLKVSKPTGWGINWGKPKVPRVIIGPNAQVVGNLIFERQVELYVHSTAKYGKIVYLEAEADKAGSLKPIVYTGKEPVF